MTQTTPKIIYTSEEVMNLFSITKRTVNTWCKKGLLRKIRKPGLRRFYITGESVEKFINEA